jgi:hypothetical protein
MPFKNQMLQEAVLENLADDSKEWQQKLTKR